VLSDYFLVAFGDVLPPEAYWWRIWSQNSSLVMGAYTGVFIFGSFNSPTSWLVVGRLCELS